MNDLGDIFKKLEPIMVRLNNNKLGSEEWEDLKRQMDEYLSELNKYREKISKLDEYIWKIQDEIEKQDEILLFINTFIYTNLCYQVFKLYLIYSLLIYLKR